MDRCDFPKCRIEADIGYIGRNICLKHWEELCNADPKTEKRILKKIGLRRNDENSVVRITT